MPWCPSCRADFSGSDDAACPTCGTRAAPRTDAPPLPSAEPQPSPSKVPPSGPSRPAHLAVLEAAGGAVDAGGELATERVPKRRLVSSAGPAVPIRKQANDSVPSSWMSRLEAARVTTTSTPPSEAEPRAEEKQPARPPPLRPSGAQSASGANGTAPKKEQGSVGKPAHLLIAELEAEEKKRSDEHAERVAALFADDRSDEIAKVQVLIKDEPKKKKLPDWVVALVLVVLVVGAAGIALVMARKEPGPKAEIDPAIAAAAEKKKQAIAALEEGHRIVADKTKADDALKAYQKAIELDPTLASAERGLAIAFAAKNDDANAVEHYRKYLSLAPNASDAEKVRKIIESYEKAKKQAETPPETKTPAPASRTTAKARAQKKH